MQILLEQLRQHRRAHKDSIYLARLLTCARQRSGASSARIEAHWHLLDAREVIKAIRALRSEV